MDTVSAKGKVSVRGNMSARECRIRNRKGVRDWSRAGRPRNGCGVTARSENVSARGTVQAGPGTEAGVTSKKKDPREVYLTGGVNPAATYSPGSEDQVPSAIWGLTSVFGMGTGTAETISAWNQTFSQSTGCRSKAGPGCPRGQTNRIVERKEKLLTGY